MKMRLTEEESDLNSSSFDIPSVLKKILRRESRKGFASEALSLPTNARGTSFGQYPRAHR